MNTVVRAAVAAAAALLGFGGFVAVQAATGTDDQPAKREDSLSVLTTADDSPSPDDTPSPEDSAVQQGAPAVQDDSPDAVADQSTRTRTGHDGAITDRDDSRGDVTDVTSTQTRTRTRGDDVIGIDTSGDDTSGHGGGDRSGSNSGQG